MCQQTLFCDREHFEGEDRGCSESRRSGFRLDCQTLFILSGETHLPPTSQTDNNKHTRRHQVEDRGHAYRYLYTRFVVRTVCKTRWWPTQHSFFEAHDRRHATPNQKARWKWVCDFLIIFLMRLICLSWLCALFWRCVISLVEDTGRRQLKLTFDNERRGRAVGVTRRTTWPITHIYIYIYVWYIISVHETSPLTDQIKQLWKHNISSYTWSEFPMPAGHVDFHESTLYFTIEYNNVP